MNRLRDMREDHDLKQADVAKIIGTTRQNYCSYENEVRALPIHHYITLAEYYGVSVDFLCGFSDKRETPGAGMMLSPEELSLLKQYRLHPEMQPAVKKLLGIR